jgi:cytochrome b561
MPVETLRPACYTGTAIVLHWLMALGLVATFALGLYMHELPVSPRRLVLYAWHKWAGVTLFLLLCLRLAWRFAHPPPPPPPMPAWQLVTARAVHVLLYVFMIAVPVSGWLMSSAKGFTTVWFGVVPLPDLVARDKALGEVLTVVHRTLNFGFAAAVLLHVGAALKHQFITKDGLMARMGLACVRRRS